MTSALKTSCAGRATRQSRNPWPYILILLTSRFAIVAPAATPDAPPMPGRLVDAGGHRIHLRCTGSRGPAVVFEAGAGAFSIDFALAQREVESFARVCSYDRAGYAWSEPGPLPRTMRQIAHELHNSLHTAGVKPPYVLVGHSLGGLMVRTFARMYPREVAGLILEDSTSEDTVLSLNGKPVRMREMSKGRPIPSPQDGPGTAQAPLTNGSAQSSGEGKLDPPFDRLPAPERRARAWAQSLAGFGTTNNAEFELLPEEMDGMFKERQTNPHPLGDAPLVVLVPAESPDSGSGPPSEEYQRIMQEKRQQKRDMAKLSTNGVYIEVRDTSHEIHIDKPKALAQAIRAVVEAARRPANKRTLPPAGKILEP